ncbi:MAG: peptidase M20 [Candidatus Cloacimonadota bacterium]|nr:MAG: peptidase M20 [Candidatus Cloacimonadota bacterium]
MVNISKDILKRSKDLIELRRNFHKIPELYFQEFDTSKLLQKLLDEKGIEYKVIAKTGLVLTIGEDKSKNAIMFRADMDALAILEENTFDYCSTNDGAMHACGHDAHMAILLTTIFWLKENESKLKKAVKFVFQPAEEKSGGAKVMIDEGVMLNPKVSQVFGLHIANRLKSNVLGIKKGIASSYCDEFQVKIIGKGGHGARPYQCVEPIMLATKFITECQLMMARDLSALDSAVMTFTSIHSGKSFNVIDDVCDLGGTLRTLSLDSRDLIINNINKKVKAYELEYDCKINFDLIEGYPAILNDDKSCDVIINTSKEIVGDKNIIEDGLGMGGEDVAFFLQEAPGCYFLLGCGGDSLDYSPHHNSTFDFDESSLITGVAIFTNVIKKLGM